MLFDKRIEGRTTQPECSDQNETSTTASDNATIGDLLAGRRLTDVEDIPDPLDDLVKRSKADAGAAFMPEVLKQLAALKEEDRPAFELLRSNLKKAGCRVSALDAAIAEELGAIGGRGPTQADRLVELAQEAELFHAPDGTAYADFTINGHRETWPIRSTGFKDLLTHRYYEATAGAPC